MDLSRIENVIDVRRTQQACVAVFGVGGAAGLVCNLARCGVGRFKLNDFDRVSASNIARQQHDVTNVGRFKTHSLVGPLHAINPDVIVEASEQNFLQMHSDVLDQQFADCDLLIVATDNFAAQLAGNALALRLQIPAIFVGLYPGGVGGEIIFWRPGIDACLSCLCNSRRQAHEKAAQESRSLDPASDGVTIFDVTFIDSIAGMIALGLLTQGSDNRFGRLLESLGQRNFIQAQIDPSWTIGRTSPVRKYLGVADDCPAYFAWNTIVREDPETLPCPDCERFRSHSFIRQGDVWIRVKPDAPTSR
jgi:molybdopterin/thiamine biosynthesis adenylyltransferase